MRCKFYNLIMKKVSFIKPFIVKIEMNNKMFEAQDQTLNNHD